MWNHEYRISLVLTDPPKSMGEPLGSPSTFNLHVRLRGPRDLLCRNDTAAHWDVNTMRVGIVDAINLISLIPTSCPIRKNVHLMPFAVGDAQGNPTFDKNARYNFVPCNFGHFPSLEGIVNADIVF